MTKILETAEQKVRNCQHNWLPAITEIVHQKDSDGNEHVFQVLKAQVCGNCKVGMGISLPSSFIASSLVSAEDLEEAIKQGIADEDKLQVHA